MHYMLTAYCICAAAMHEASGLQGLVGTIDSSWAALGDRVFFMQLNGNFINGKQAPRAP